MSSESDINTGREVKYSSDPVELVEQISADLPEDEREAMMAEARSLQGLDPLTGHDLTPEDKAAADKAEADKAAADKAEADKAEADKAEADKAEADKAEADKAAADKAEADKAAEEKAGVRTADGDGVLDYSVLAQAREDTRRARAEAAAAEARAEAAKTAAKPEDAKPDPAAEKLKQAIATLRENEGDAVADAYEAIAGAVTQKDEKIAELQGRLDRQDQSAIEEVRSNSQREIDANPTLAKWQAEFLAAQQGVDGKSGLRWEQAEALDEVLERDPEWKGRPLSDRFSEVVRILEGGAPSESGAPSDASQAAADKAAADKAAADKAAADKAAADKPGAKTGPGSISDLPSGDTPDSPLTKFENMSPQEIEAAITARDGSMAEFDAIMSQVA